MTNIERFLNGEIAIHVETLDQSKFLINLSLKNGFPKDGCEDVFHVNTYKDYPYYFIEDKMQLQANKERREALNYSDAVKIEEFDDVFENIDVKK